MQNDAKMHDKSPRNEHEKKMNSDRAMLKTHAVDRPAKLHRNAFAFVVPGVALLTPWLQKNAQRWLELEFCRVQNA